VRVALIFNKRVCVVLNVPTAEAGTHETDGMTAGTNVRVERAEGIVVGCKDKLGAVRARDRNGD
jgi:hypothetical protein